MFVELFESHSIIYDTLSFKAEYKGFRCHSLVVDNWLYDQDVLGLNTGLQAKAPHIVEVSHITHVQKKKIAPPNGCRISFQ